MDEMIAKVEPAGPIYAAFLQGMEAAAQICGSLAETTYDDSDGFEAATGCEAAIMGCVRVNRQLDPEQNRLVMHIISNATMNPASLEHIGAEAARTLLIGIAREAQELTGLTVDRACALIEPKYSS